VHGVKFEWSSSDGKKLEIDDAGGAKLLAPGLVTVTCQAGLVQATAVVAIRPGARRVQTDAEWNADQASVSSSGVGMLEDQPEPQAPLMAEGSDSTDVPVGITPDTATHDGRRNVAAYKVGKGRLRPRFADPEAAGVNRPSEPERIQSRRSVEVSATRMTARGSRPAALKLAPTASLQGGGSGNDIPAAAGIDDVGSPPHAIREPSRLGPIKPRYNFELGIPIVSLGGRGIGASVGAFYNSNVWGARVDQISQPWMTFDPIQSWPSPGFSLGFGRMVYYALPNDPVFMYRYVWVDPDGTRHYLGQGHQSNQNTLRALDGSNITFVGAATTGGALYDNGGTKVTIGVVNNRLLPTQITEPGGGNYIQIAPTNSARRGSPPWRLTI
jgi:hypothetical protein